MDIKQNQPGQAAAPAAGIPAAAIKLQEAVISEQDLENLADFTVRFPTYLPEMFPAQKITGLKREGDPTVRSTNFILHYGSGKDHWLMIEQATTGRSLQFHTLVDQVNIDGEEVSIYKQTEHVSGIFTHYYFELGDVSFTVSSVGLPEEELWNVITSLQPKP